MSEQRGGFEETEALDLRYYASLAYRFLPLLVAVPVVLGALAFVNADRQTRMYSATSQVLLRPNDPNERLGSSSQAINQTSNIEQYVRSQGNLARSPEIRETVAATLETDAQEIEDAIKVAALVDSNTLEITATAEDPEWAKQVADAVAVEYIANRREYARAGLERALDDIATKLEQVEEQLRTLSSTSTNAQIQAELTAANAQYEELTTKRYELEIDLNLKNGEAELIAEADVPDAPVSPRPARSAILGAMLGVLLAAGIVLLKDRFDTRLRSREEAEAVTGLAALGELPFDRVTDRQATGVGVFRDPDGPLAEAVRSLRVSLRFLSLETPMQVVLITSPTPGDGKSTTSLNLAGSYAKAGMRTLLVSGDLRRPQAEKLVGSTPGPGLVELLTEMAVRREQLAALAEPVRRPKDVAGDDAAARRRARTATAVEAPKESPVFITEWCHADEANLWVLPAGTPVANPVEILGSVATRDFFLLAREQFDMVIVDSPPVIAVADPVVLSPYVDGVVLVCSIRKTSRSALERASELMRAGHGRMLGLVVNRVPQSKQYNGYYYSPNKTIE